MALKHEIKDADVHFVVNADSRKIVKQNNTKVYLMQYDHNSEEFTFDVPRYIETHDMSECDVIQVHYENTSTGTSASMRKTYRGVKVIDQSKVEVDEDIISFGWLVPENATTFAGTLKFQLKFICYDSEDGTTEGYKWHSDVNEDIGIKSGLGYAESDFDPTTTATLQSLEIVEIEGGLEIILDGMHYALYSGGGGTVIPTDVERTSNKVTSVGKNSTNAQYPSAKAVWEAIVKYVSDNVTTGNLPTAGSGDNGKIIEVSNGSYVLKFVSNSSVSTYVSGLKSTEINANSSDDKIPTAKAVYNLFEAYKSSVNASIIEALNTDVEV